VLQIVTLVLLQLQLQPQIQRMQKMHTMKQQLVKVQHMVFLLEQLQVRQKALHFVCAVAI
jgi:hypothetical protein